MLWAEKQLQGMTIFQCDEATLLLMQLFELAANGGHGTVCMFGQTGSGEVCKDVALQVVLKICSITLDTSSSATTGKTFTMAGILQHAAASLFQGDANSICLWHSDSFLQALVNMNITAV